MCSLIPVGLVSFLELDTPRLYVQKGHVKTDRIWTSATREERIPKKSAMPAPWPQTSHIQNHEKINVCCAATWSAVVCYGSPRKLMHMAKGNQVVDRIEIDNQMTLKWGEYPRLFGSIIQVNVITRVLKRGRGRQKKMSQRDSSVVFQSALNRTILGEQKFM